MIPPKNVKVKADKEAEQTLHWLIEDIYRRLGKQIQTTEEITNQVTNLTTVIGAGGVTEGVVEEELPLPSPVINVAVTDETNFIDPITNLTMARVTVSWDDNPEDEKVDLYEIVWTE